MFLISSILDYVCSKPTVKAIAKRRYINDTHKRQTEIHISDRKKPIYYIIRYEDGMSCGWTVWERVVLYGAIYAKDHNMIPVIDMQSTKNIYLEDDEVGMVNAWEKYYEQPGGISFREALESRNYILADPTQEWFEYIRMRRPYRFTAQYLREQYTKYIHLNKNTELRCEKNFQKICPDASNNPRMLGICMRGSDYKLYHHPLQPDSENILEEAKRVFREIGCDYYYVATEDYEILCSLCEKLPKELILSYKAGEIKQADGLIGKQIRLSKSADEAAIDYLTTLYILNRCVGLIGGKCGATIVAEYRKNPEYEYFNVIDFQKSY